MIWNPWNEDRTEKRQKTKTRQMAVTFAYFFQARSPILFIVTATEANMK